MGIVPPIIHDPISRPTIIRMKIAGIVLDSFDTIESIMSSQECPRPNAITQATTADTSISNSGLSPITP